MNKLTTEQSCCYYKIQLVPATSKKFTSERVHLYEVFYCEKHFEGDDGHMYLVNILRFLLVPVQAEEGEVKKENESDQCMKFSAVGNCQSEASELLAAFYHPKRFGVQNGSLDLKPDSRVDFVYFSC